MKQEEILFFLGSIVVVVFAWIAFTLIHNSLTSTLSGSTLQIITPINSTFDTKVIDAMKKRTVVLPLNTIPPQSQNEIITTGTPLPTSAIATSSSKTATQGGSFQ